MHLHLSIAVAIWLTVSFGGVAVSQGLVRLFIGYQQAARGITRSRLLRELGVETTNYNTYTELIRLSSHLVSSFIGVYSVFDLPVATTVVVAGLIYINSCAIYNSILTLRTWKKREAIYRSGRKNGSHGEPSAPPPAAMSKGAAGKILAQVRVLSRRQDAADARADVADVVVIDHEERIEVVETEVSVKQTIEKKEPE